MSENDTQPPEDALVELKILFGSRLDTSTAACKAHGRGEGFATSAPPDAVAYPTSTQELSALAKICHAHAIPMVPFGAGTSLEGHVAALHGGVSIDFSHMNRILAVHTEDMDAVVEPGVTRKQLNRHLRDTGLFFPIDPGADATIGGMCATRASGTAAVKYGTMKDSVLALEVVLADGRIITTARRARKSAAGYDLTRLFVGSEGTLGLITKITLTLHGIPEATTAVVCAFPTVENAVDCVIATLQMGLPCARIELLDALAMKALNAYAKEAYDEAPTLFVEFEGGPGALAEHITTFQDIANDFAARGLQWADKPEERSRLWAARHNAYFAGLALKPGHRALTTDVCVPLSALAPCISHTHQILAQSPLTGIVLGHVGDGNYHTMILFDPDEALEYEEAERLNAQIVAQALSMDGTCTGEHGIGLGKMESLRRELGEETIDTMRALKTALDPMNIMNPGKIFSSVRP